MVLGTVGYMAPEQIRGQPAGPHSDIFAVGAIFYELLTGRRAFEARKAADMSEAVLTREPIPLRWACPAASSEVVAIVERCLAKLPEARYQSGAELAAAMSPGLARETGPPGKPPGRQQGPGRRWFPWRLWP
jgi:serine/threonine protein kinase